MAKKKLVCGRALAVLMSVSLSAQLNRFPRHGGWRNLR